MAPVLRRRRFTIFITICCVSLVVITWFSSNYNEETLNNQIITDIYENFIPSNQEQQLNQKKLPVIEQKSEYTVIKQSKTATQLRESQNIHSPHQSIKSSSKDRFYKYPDEYEFVDSQDFESDPIVYEDQKKFLDEYDITPYGMARTHDNMINTYRQTKEGISKNRRELTTYDINYSIDNVEDCDDCEEYFDVTAANIVERPSSIKNPSLIIDTPGCKIPNLDPWDPSVAHLIDLYNPVVCPGPPLFMRPSSDGSISLNETVLKEYYNMTAAELVCNYQAIYRVHERSLSRREVSFVIGNVTKLQFGVPLNEDYVGVGCKMKNKTTNFEQFFPLIRLKNRIEEERNAMTSPKPKLNVILAGIDSVSKLNFLRHFSRTYTYLNEKMSPFEMNGYTKVGDNTFPNLVPMLTGHFVEYYWNESLKNTKYFDDLDLIWKDYAKKGYRTFYAEDNPMAGTFNYMKRGFYDPPTDYYFRPLALVLAGSTLTQGRKEPCLNSQLETDIIYDYLRDFVKAMEDRPYFAFAMVSTLTHDLLNFASWADEPTVNLLEDLSNQGALNNSLLVLFSDHGIRFGKIRYTYIGKYEERMPFMYIHVPEWFLNMYPVFAKNLKTNQDRLMTLFDIHATMIHLLDLNKTHKERSTVTLGTSLFDEIPANRTCDDAHILRHWCPCETFQAVATNASQAIKASRAIVNDINFQLESYSDICEVLKVDEIMGALVGKANDIVLRYVRAENEVLNKKIILGNKIEPIADYMITLVTKPGGAIFEGTVRFDPPSDSYTVLGISRLTLYGTTSWCIDSQKLKLFCYCKVQKES